MRIQQIFTMTVLLGLMMALAPMTPSPARAASLIPVESFLKADGSLNPSTGINGTVDLRGWDVTLDSVRGPILSPQSSAPAAPTVATWGALANNGLNNGVNALAVIGTDLYVGGNFTATSDGAVTLNRIAKYSNGVWTALAHQGLNNSVLALAVSGTDLYVGGDFSATSDGALTNLGGIAKYSGGNWSAFSNKGINGNVQALAVVGTDLYVGGSFFASGDGSVTNLGQIAKYSGGVWSALPHQGLNGSVQALAVIGTDLYVGGAFTQTADSNVNILHIAKYDGAAWSPLAHNGLNTSVNVIVVSGTDLYLGGSFTATGDGAVTNLNRVAKYSGGDWSALPNHGLNNLVTRMVMIGTDLYVGGYFSATDDGAVTNLARIAKLNIPIVTTTTLTGPSGNFTGAQSFTFTATVVDASLFTAPVKGRAPSQTGTVTFYDNNVVIPTCANVALVAGVATCTVTLQPGTHVIRAHYNGDTNFAPSDSTTTLTLAVTVNAAPRDVPESDTLLLLGGGIGGVGVWLRWQWSKRRVKK